MTALDLIEKAESLADADRAAALASRVLGMDDESAIAAHPRAHRLLALAAWPDDLYEARRHFAAAADLLARHNHGDTALLASALGDLALAHYNLHAYPEALRLRRRALAMVRSRKAENPALVRQLKRRLAQSLQHAGKMEAAARYYRKSRPAPTDGPSEHLGWLNAMALFSEQSGRIAEAAEWYTRLADFLNETPDVQGAVAALGNIVLFMLESDRIHLAATQLNAMRHKARTDRSLTARIAQYDVRMLLLQIRKRHQAAAGIAMRAEGLARLHAPDDPALASRAALIAANLRAAGQPEAAMTWLERYRPEDAEVTAAHTALMVELATGLRAQGQGRMARRALVLALTAELGGPGTDPKFHVLAGLSELAADDGRPRAAALLGKIALDHLRRTARDIVDGAHSGWLRARMDLYDRILTHLAASGRLPEAQALQLRRWAEVSWEFGRCADTIAAPDAVPYRPGEERMRDALDSIEAAAGDLASSSDRADALRRVEHWLDTVWAEDFEHKAAPQLRPVNAPWHGARLTYLPKGKSFIGVFERDGVRQEFSLAMPDGDIANAALALRTAFERRLPGWRPASEALYDALIAPVEKQIADAGRIDLVLSGIASFIPFSALSTQERFLVEIADIAVRTGRQRSASQGLVADFGKAAAFGSSGSEGAPLARAPREAASLSERTGGDLYLDHAFTAAALRNALARGVELLHLAGHFRYVPARPHRSALLLGDGTELTLATLAGPDYDFSSVRLLVLAACDTAIADSLDIGLEGLAGIAQAKGAQTVLATLWRIDDASAAHLMQRFYDHLFADAGRDPVAALGAAQRRVLTEARAHSARPAGLGSPRLPGLHPADWSGFAAYVADDMPGR